MTYSKEMTSFIVECWGKGLTAQETVQAIKQVKGKTISLQTVFNTIYSMTTKSYKPHLP